MSELQIVLDLREARSVPPEITETDARRIGNFLGVDWNTVSLKELHRGIRVEFEHHDLIGNDAVAAARIALAHLKELPDYYTRLAGLERSAR